MMKSIVIALVGVVVGLTTGFAIGSHISAKNTRATVEVFVNSQETVLLDAISNIGSRVETKIDNNFDKIKSKRSEPINIVIDPQTNSVISNADTSQVITVQKEKGFFKRIFNKKQ